MEVEAVPRQIFVFFFRIADAGVEVFYSHGVQRFFHAFIKHTPEPAVPRFVRYVNGKFAGLGVSRSGHKRAGISITLNGSRVFNDKVGVLS